MENQVTASELYQIIGNKDVIIYKLQQQLELMAKRLAELEAKNGDKSVQT